MVWTPIRKTLFRFFVVYVLLYMILYTGIFLFDIEYALTDLLSWFTKYILFQDIQEKLIFPDFNFYFLIFNTSISFLVTIFWSVLDRRSKDYTRLFRVYTSILFYFLAYQMLMYGLVKIFGIQFEQPSAVELHTPLGEMSPSNLVWRMMGYSYAYSSFTGWLEVAACLLLLIARTRTMGALLTLGIMTNVVALNYFYDISVILHATHLLAMTIFLVILDAPRLWSFFVMNRTVEPKDLSPVFFKGRNTFIKIIPVLMIIILSCFAMARTFSMKQKHEQENPGELLGIYKVRYFQTDWHKRKELDISDWKEIEIYDRDNATLKSYDDNINWYSFSIDLTKGTVLLEDTLNASILNLDIVSHNKVGTKVTGIYEGDTLYIKVVKMHPSDFRLMRP